MSWPAVTEYRPPCSVPRGGRSSLRDRQPGHCHDRREGLQPDLGPGRAPRPAEGQQPRPYDFRPHFAYANVERWARKGKDATAMLPYLARYMGHASIDSSYYYIHTSPDLMHDYAHLMAES